VRASWGREFSSYVQHNGLATQRLLERYREAKLERFVYASSSSVYGDAERYPTPEDALPRPVSPYGVTKLAGEHLALL
jgi:nucleoside-diphosphate-sugar epimerase